MRRGIRGSLRGGNSVRRVWKSGRRLRVIVIGFIRGGSWRVRRRRRKVSEGEMINGCMSDCCYIVLLASIDETIPFFV